MTGRTLLLASVVVVLAACNSGSQRGAAPSTTTAPPVTQATAPQVQSCTGPQLRVTEGERIGGQTEQIGLSLRLTNESHRTCSLTGYAALVILDEHAQPLPFLYSHLGNQTVSGRAPRSVELAHGVSAFVGLAHNSCVVHQYATGTTVVATLPTVSKSFRVVVGRYSGLGYCGKGDPGSVMYVSPIASNLHQTLAQ